MNGTHAQLAVKPPSACPLRRLADEYRIREFAPADESTPAQAVLNADDDAALADDPAVTSVVETDDAVVCRIEPSVDDTPHDGSDRCLTRGVDYLPVRPYARFWDGEWYRLTVAVTDPGVVQACVSELEAAGLSATVETVGLDAAPTGPKTALVAFDDLTPRQREVAELAVERDYYSPDGAAAAELADELGISKATLSEHLRAVREKIGSDVFTPD